MMLTLPNSHCSQAIALRVLLILSLWEGPVLWVHQHSLEVVGLSKHLEQFHSDAQTEIADNAEWHWHLSWPASSEPCEGQSGESTPRSRNVTQTVSSATSLSWVMQLSVSLDSFSDFEPSSNRLLHSARKDRAFLATYCPAHSMQQVLCRMSC